MDAVARFKKTPDSWRLADCERLMAVELQSMFIAQEVELAVLCDGYNFHGVDKPGKEEAKNGLRYAKFVVPFVITFRSNIPSSKRCNKTTWLCNLTWTKRHR